MLVYSLGYWFGIKSTTPCALLNSWLVAGQQHTTLSAIHHRKKIVCQLFSLWLNPLKPEFTIVISIHYKPRIAVAILDLYWMKMTLSGWQMKRELVIIRNAPWKFLFLKPLGAEIKSFFRDTKWFFDASWGFKGLLSGKRVWFWQNTQGHKHCSLGWVQSGVRSGELRSTWGQQGCHLWSQPGCLYLYNNGPMFKTMEYHLGILCCWIFTMFHSFKAGIEVSIFSFKWHKNISTEKKFDTYQLELYD